MSRLPITEVLDPAPADGPDWEAIERDYRTGKFTLRQLAAKHGSSAPTIMRRARDGGWTQDIAPLVDAERERKLAAAAVRERRALAETAVSRQGETTLKQATPVSAPPEVQELAEAVDVVSDAQVAVVLGQRTRARKAAEVASGLMAELATLAVAAEDQDALAEVLAADSLQDVDPKRLERAREAARKAVDLGNRAGTLKAITDALAKIQAMETQAYRLDKPQEPGATTLPDPATIPPEQYMAVYMAFVTGIGKPSALPRPGS